MSNKIDSIIVSTSNVPIEFHRAIAQATSLIARQEGFEDARLREPLSDWQSRDFGYLIGFYNPTNASPSTGYDEFRALTGYEHRLVYLPRDTVSDMMLEFARGSDLSPLLQTLMHSKWDEFDLTDEDIFQTMTGILRASYQDAVLSNRRIYLPDDSLRFRVEFYIDDESLYTVSVHERDCNYRFQFPDKDYLKKMIDVYAIMRDTRIYYSSFELFSESWSEGPPICWP